MPQSISLEVIIVSRFVRTYGTCIHHVTYHSSHCIVSPLIVLLSLLDKNNNLIIILIRVVTLLKMAHTKLTTRMSARGRAHHHQVARREPHCKSWFLGEFDMPT